MAFFFVTCSNLLTGDFGLGLTMTKSSSLLTLTGDCETDCSLVTVFIGGLSLLVRLISRCFFGEESRGTDSSSMLTLPAGKTDPLLGTAFFKGASLLTSDLIAWDFFAEEGWGIDFSLRSSSRSVLFDNWRSYGELTFFFSFVRTPFLLNGDKTRLFTFTLGGEDGPWEGGGGGGGGGDDNGDEVGFFSASISKIK